MELGFFGFIIVAIVLWLCKGAVKAVINAVTPLAKSAENVAKAVQIETAKIHADSVKSFLDDCDIDEQSIEDAYSKLQKLEQASHVKKTK